MTDSKATPHEGFQQALDNATAPREVWRISPYDGEALDPDRMAYKAKSGKWQIKPSALLLLELDEAGLGFCLNCGEAEQLAEPDAVQYTCECCGEAKVYGAAELALRGLSF